MEGPLLPMGEKEKYDDCPETVLNYARSRNGLDTLYFYYGSKYVTFLKGLTDWDGILDYSVHTWKELRI